MDRLPDELKAEIVDQLDGDESDEVWEALWQLSLVNGIFVRLGFPCRWSASRS